MVAVTPLLKTADVNYLLSVREGRLCKETKPKIFRLLYWKRSDGLEKIILDGRMNGKREKGRKEGNGKGS